MPKRFTDTAIWEKEWFMKLSPKHKCLWRYITERCDQAGVWEPNWQLASIYIGDTCSSSDLKLLGEHVEVLKNGKVYVPDFINFQYGRLSETSPAHKPVFRAIEKHSLSNRVFNRVSNTLQEEEEEEVKDKEEEKEKEILVVKAKIEDCLRDALNPIFVDKIAVNWGHIDFKQEVISFKDKVLGAPGKYGDRDSEGLRMAFISHLRTAKAVPVKSNGYSPGKFQQ